MTHSAGAVVFGIAHTPESGRKAVASYKRFGLKEGDVVAVEYTPVELTKILQYLEDGTIEKRIQQARGEMESLSLQLASKDISVDDRKVLMQKHEWASHTYGGYGYLHTVFPFLLKKGARIVGFENNSKDALMRKSRKGYGSGRVLSRNEHRLLSFLLLPVRERKWNKKLKEIRPDFIECGYNHVPAIKKAIPCKAILDLTGLKLSEKIKYRLQAARIRAHYNIYRAAKRLRHRARRL